MHPQNGSLQNAVLRKQPSENLLQTAEFALDASQLQTAVDDDNLAENKVKALLSEPLGQKVASLELELVVSRAAIQHVRLAHPRLPVLVGLALVVLPVLRHQVDEDARLHAFYGLVGADPYPHWFFVSDGDQFQSDWELVVFELNELSLEEFGVQGELLDGVLLEAILLMLLHGFAIGLQSIFLRDYAQKRGEVPFCVF
jgi:hypothetical protein